MHFFSYVKMLKIYIYSGSFNLSYQLSKIVYPYLISSGINLIIEYLSLSENSIISIKYKMNINKDEEKKIKNKMKIKFCFLFIITYI